MQFENINDASMYLTGSFVKFYFNDKPNEIRYGKVREVSNQNLEDYFGPCAYITEHGKRKSVWHKLDDITFPPQDIQLGNLKYEGHVLYCQRIPVRRAVMGITQNSFMFHVLGQQDEHFLWPEFSDLSASPEFLEMIQGKYPTIEEAASTREPMPFSRYFSLDPIALTVSHLRYRGDIVGEFVRNEFIFYKPYEWCMDTLRRELNKQGAEQNYEISLAA